MKETPEQQFLRACRQGDLKQAKTLLAQSSIDIQKCGYDALAIALGQKNMPLFCFLHQKGADIHANNEALLKEALIFHYAPAIRYLLCQNANPDKIEDAIFVETAYHFGPKMLASIFTIEPIFANPAGTEKLWCRFPDEQKSEQLMKDYQSLKAQFFLVKKKRPKRIAQPYSLSSV